MEIGQRLPLRENQDIDTSIVIYVADSKPATQQRNLEGRASSIRYIKILNRPPSSEPKNIRGRM